MRSSEAGVLQATGWNITFFGKQLVTGSRTFLSSSPLRFRCWLQLCKGTEIVVFSPSWVALVCYFCLGEKKKKNNSHTTRFHSLRCKCMLWCAGDFRFRNKLWHTWSHNKGERRQIKIFTVFQPIPGVCKWVLLRLQAEGKQYRKSKT